MSEDKPNILIVDQDRFSSLINKMLSARYSVETAIDGPSAVRILSDGPPRFSNDSGTTMGGLYLKQFWRHSIGTAFISRAADKKLKTEVEAAFLGRMLHNLGKVVLDRYFATIMAPSSSRSPETVLA